MYDQGKSCSVRCQGIGRDEGELDQLCYRALCCAGVQWLLAYHPYSIVAIPHNQIYTPRDVYSVYLRSVGVSVGFRAQCQHSLWMCLAVGVFTVIGLFDNVIYHSATNFLALLK